MLVAAGIVARIMVGMMMFGMSVRPVRMGWLRLGGGNQHRTANKGGSHRE